MPTIRRYLFGYFGVPGGLKRSSMKYVRTSATAIGLLFIFLAIPIAVLADQDETAAPHWDWRWVHGAVYVPTNCVNEGADVGRVRPNRHRPRTALRSIYGINCVRVSCTTTSTSRKNLPC